MDCAIWYNLYKKARKNTYGGVPLLVKLRVPVWNFAESVTSHIFFFYNCFINK